MNNTHAPSIGWFEQLVKKVDVVTDKVISILKNEIGCNTPIGYFLQNSDVEYGIRRVRFRKIGYRTDEYMIMESNHWL